MSEDQYINIGVTLHIRKWSGEKTPFVLIHGLSSNCRTWDSVAEKLAQAGHSVITVDQRGHGLSDKPDNGYDFDTVTADLNKLITELSLNAPIVVGQSWGGNVVLEFGTRYPGVAGGLGFIDGGFLDFQANPENTWERISVDLKPPSLSGMHYDDLYQRMQAGHPDWTAQGIVNTLANFEKLADGTVRAWLTLERHMKILRALWEQRPPQLYSQVQEPVLICPAKQQGNATWVESKINQVTIAERELAFVEVQWFENTDHDIHVHRPDQLATVFLDSISDGIWAKGAVS